MIFQPVPGVYADVHEIDFTSLYPAIIVKYNLSPEVPDGKGREGFLPAVLAPLLDMRIRSKRLKKSSPRTRGWTRSSSGCSSPASGTRATKTPSSGGSRSTRGSPPAPGRSSSQRRRSPRGWISLSSTGWWTALGEGGGDWQVQGAGRGGSRHPHRARDLRLAHLPPPRRREWRLQPLLREDGRGRDEGERGRGEEGRYPGLHQADAGGDVRRDGGGGGPGRAAQARPGDSGGSTCGMPNGSPGPARGRWSSAGA